MERWQIIYPSCFDFILFIIHYHPPLHTYWMTSMQDQNQKETGKPMTVIENRPKWCWQHVKCWWVLVLKEGEETIWLKKKWEERERKVMRKTEKEEMWSNGRCRRKGKGKEQRKMVSLDGKMRWGWRWEGGGETGRKANEKTESRLGVQNKLEENRDWKCLWKDHEQIYNMISWRVWGIGMVAGVVWMKDRDRGDGGEG